MKYLIDTDWVIEYLKGREPVTQTLSGLAHDGLAISILTYGEVYEGIYFGRKPQDNEQAFQSFLRGVNIVPLTQAIMRQYANIRGTLRKQGLLIGDIDILIAATALEYDLTLLTSNTRHYVRIPNLKLYQHPV